MVASFKQIQPYIIQSESGGKNYTSQQNYNYPTSTASGYYQITNTTWGSIPASITGGTGSAYQASYAQQTAAAQYLWEKNAGADWINWNPTVRSANQAFTSGGTPSTPVSSTVTQLIAGGDGIDPPGTYTLPNPMTTPDNPPFTEAPYTPGAPASPGGANVPATIGNPLATIGAWLGNWFVRLGLIAVGIVLIGAAAANLAKEHDVLPAMPIPE